MPTGDLDTALRRCGYEQLGGVANRVFLHRGRGEVLKLAVSEDPVPFRYRIAGFRACREVSARYAPEGLLPEVLAAGEDFAGTGYPYLRERYVPGRNLAAAYLDDPAWWDARLPAEIVRLYTVMLDSPTRDAAGFWDEKLAKIEALRASPHHPRFADLLARHRDATLAMRERHPTGHRLHGDLQFGNLLAPDAGPPGRVMLLDWELTTVLPPVFEFAHFYAFLHDPVPQLEEGLQRGYRRLGPLRRLWVRLAPRLHSAFGIGGEEFRDAVLIHSGGGIFWLDRALRAGRDAEAAYWERSVRRVVAGEIFAALPIPG